MRFGTAFLISVMVGVSAGQAASLTTLVSFNDSDGADLVAGLIADASGNLFGTTSGGGANGVGTVFEITKTGGSYASTPTTLVNFNFSNGFEPYGNLIADAAGNLFGTTMGGGANDDGTVFEIAKTGRSYASTPTALGIFYGSNGAHPDGGLIADASGNLFGTTGGGGANGDGAVFKIAKAGDGYATALASFNGTNGVDPFGGLLADAHGDLFGATDEGGANGDGTVFEVAKTVSGSYVLITLATFNGSNGAGPFAGLVADAAGNLFGTTTGGGANDDGTVFELANNGTGSYTLTTLLAFDGTNGWDPSAGLIIDAAGDLFGTTAIGGAAYSSTNGEEGFGTIFEIAKTSGGYATTPTTLVSFDDTNGESPVAGLLADAAGNLFGTTSNGGDNNNEPDDGTVFEVSDSGFVTAANRSNVPEPASIALLATGLTGLMFDRRRKRAIGRATSLPRQRRRTDCLQALRS